MIRLARHRDSGTAPSSRTTSCTTAPHKLLQRSSLTTSLVVAALTLTPLYCQKFSLAADGSNQDQAQLLPSEPLVREQLSRALEVEQADRIAMREPGPAVGRVYPVPSLDKVDVLSSRGGDITLSVRPRFEKRVGDRYASVTERNNFVFYTLDPELQAHVSSIVRQARAAHVAIVAMNPSTGAILAMAGKSNSISDIEYHVGFPAASLFKVVTAAAAIEHAGIDSYSLIPFRGGTYTLNQANYYPDPRRDSRIMSVGEALGRSCNPVFGHIGVRYLNGQILGLYARRFGFNQSLGFEAPLAESKAWIPQDDKYELSRTSAGFGEVRVSPIHAAAFMAGIANGGALPKPQIVDSITSSDGTVLYRQKGEMVQRIVETTTAQTLMEMMRNTTTVGTSRREFMRGASPTLGAIDVAGKTGTLSGDNPQGLNNWFIGAAPINDPKIAISVITVDPQHSSKASHLARLVLQKFFGVSAPEPTYSGASGKSAPRKKAAKFNAKKPKAKGSYAKHSRRKQA